MFASLLRRLDRALALRRSEVDRALGVETTRNVSPQRLVTGSARDADNVGYGATPRRVLTRILDRLDVAGAHFLDLGCGKGATLLMAADYPFASVRGIELAPSLVAAARRNLARAGKTATVIEGDATAPALMEGLNLIWFLHPFFENAQRDLIAHLEGELRNPAKQVLLIYVNPVEAPQWDASAAFRRQFAGVIEAPTDSGTYTHRHGVIAWASLNYPHPPEASAPALWRLTIPRLGCELTLPEGAAPI